MISSTQKAGRIVLASLTECAALHFRYIAVLDFFDIFLLQAGLYIKNTQNDFNGCISRISLSISVNFTIFALF